MCVFASAYFADSALFFFVIFSFLAERIEFIFVLAEERLHE